jgi:hypothetical protein
MKRQKMLKFKPNEKTTQIENPIKCKAKPIHNKQNGHQTKFISKNHLYCNQLKNCLLKRSKVVEKKHCHTDKNKEEELQTDMTKLLHIYPYL